MSASIDMTVFSVSEFDLGMDQHLPVAESKIEGDYGNEAVGERLLSPTVGAKHQDLVLGVVSCMSSSCTRREVFVLEGVQ